jgi:Contractile injection system spike tip protein
MDYVLIDADTATFLPSFGAAVVVVQPGSLSASGPATLGGKRLCIVGDEQSVSVPGCMYMTPAYPIPGTGTLEISALAGDQQASKTSSGNAKLMLVGGQFTAKFTVQQPAQQPTPGGSPIPDATPEYSGHGSFMTTNTKFRVS